MPEDRNLVGVLESVAEPGWLDELPAEVHAYFAHAIGWRMAQANRRVVENELKSPLAAL